MTTSHSRVEEAPVPLAVLRGDIPGDAAVSTAVDLSDASAAAACGVRAPWPVIGMCPPPAWSSAPPGDWSCPLLAVGDDVEVHG